MLTKASDTAISSTSRSAKTRYSLTTVVTVRCLASLSADRGLEDALYVLRLLKFTAGATNWKLSLPVESRYSVDARKVEGRMSDTQTDKAV